MFDPKALATAPLRIYHLIDYDATLIATANSNTDVLHLLRGCRPAKDRFEYTLRVRNSIGSNYIVSCGVTSKTIIEIPKSYFAGIAY